MILYVALGIHIRAVPPIGRLVEPPGVRCSNEALPLRRLGTCP